MFEYFTSEHEVGVFVVVAINAKITLMILNDSLPIKILMVLLHPPSLECFKGGHEGVEFGFTGAPKFRFLKK